MYFLKNKEIKWGKKTVEEVLKNLSIQYGYKLTDITKQFDSFDPTNLSQWMDNCNGHLGGWYHRVKHGHDFAANINDVYQNFGLEGIIEFPFELLKDFLTHDGIPIPGTQWLHDMDMITASNATKWCSVNAADVFAGGIAIYSTFKLHKASKRKLKTSEIVFASIGIGIKVNAGIATSNPILLLSAGADTVILIDNLECSKKAFKMVENLLKSKIAKAAGCGVLCGSASAFLTTSTIAAIGTSSTGTAIASLSGAAASKATLAALGFGSVATGGLGVVGGMAVLALVGATTAGTAAYYSYNS